MADRVCPFAPLVFFLLPSGLMKLISENAPKAIKEQQMENYFARKVAVDASMSLYQFLVRTNTAQRRMRWTTRRTPHRRRCSAKIRVAVG